MHWIPVTADPGQVGDSAFHLENLNVTFSTAEGDVHAVRNLSLAVAPARTGQVQCHSANSTVMSSGP